MTERKHQIDGEKVIYMPPLKTNFTELKEKQQPEITVEPYHYDFCACCLTCTSKNICSLGEHGDFGVCQGYEDDGSSGK